MFERLFSFSSWSKDHPRDQIPGDRLDSELDNVKSTFEAISAQIADLRRSDGALKNEIVTKDALHPSFYQQIIDMFRKGVEDDLSDAKTARNVAETSATTAVIASSAAESASARATSAASVAETSAGSLLTEIAAARTASVSLLDHIDNAHAAFRNSTIRSADAEELSAMYAELSSLWAEYMPDTIPPNKLAEMDITGDHWSSRWWANKAENAFGKMSELYLGAWPTPPTHTSTGGAIPLGAVYYNTTTNQTYIWTGTQWVSFWKPQKAITASLYYTLAAPATSIQVTTVMDDFGNTFGLNDEPVEVYVGAPASAGGLRLEPYAAMPSNADSGKYWVNYDAETVMFTGDLGTPLPTGTLVVMDFLASVNSLRPGSCALWPLKSFDTDPVGGGSGYQDGTRTVFVLKRNDGGLTAVESSEELLVYVNSVPQQPGIDYEVTGLTEVTFAEAPEADARTWALWMEPVGGAGSGGGAGIAPPDPPADDWRLYYGWTPAGAGSAQWFDGRGMLRVVLDETARMALVNGIDIIDGSLVVQQDTRELWIYTGITGWKLYYPALPASGTATLYYNGTYPVWLPGGSIGLTTVADVAPSSPITGQMWLESDSYALFIWQGSAWVQVNSLVASTAGTSAPGLILAPAITGTPTEGQVLTRTTGTWTGSPSSYATVWKRGGIAISGATGATYTLVTADVGGIITVTVTATNPSGSANADSAGTSAVTVAPGHRYWRINFRGNINSIGTPVVTYSLSRLEMRTVSGGAQLITADSMLTASSTNATYPVANLRDNNDTTFWASGNVSSTETVTVDFGAGNAQAVGAVQIRCRQDGFCTEAPREFWLEYSDDTVAWTRAAVFSTVLWQSVSAAREFVVPVTPAAGEYPYWRVLIADGFSGTNVGMAEFEFIVGSGVDQATTWGRVSGSISGDGVSLIDDNPSTIWATGATGWFYAVLPVPKAINKLTAQARPSFFADSMKNFVVQRSDDAVAWTTVYTAPTQAAWSASEIRTFTW